MRIRVVRQPHGTVNGEPLNRYRQGHVYDLSPSLADYLIAEGAALLEMRRDGPAQPLTGPDRRAIAQIIEEYRSGKRARLSTSHSRHK